MYNVFDNFLRTTNWEGYNRTDTRQFYKLLSQVISNSEFSIEGLNKHIDKYIFENENCDAQLQRNYLIDQATTIFEYLEITDPIY